MISHYLSDPNDDVQIATKNLLADFLQEMKTIAAVQRRTEEKIRHIREPNIHEDERRNEERLPDITMMHSERVAFIPEGEHHDGEAGAEVDLKDTGGEYAFSWERHSIDLCHSLCTWTKCEG